MLPDRPLVRRRTALTGALGGIAATLLATGCDTGDDLGESDATGSPSPSQSEAQEPEQTPDEALVDDVLARLGAAVAVLQAARRFKQLRPTVAPAAARPPCAHRGPRGRAGGGAPASDRPTCQPPSRRSERARPSSRRPRRRRRPGGERRARQAAGVDVGVDEPAPRDAPSARRRRCPRMTTELDALQATLAAEHAAVYVYGLLGSRTSQSAEPELYVALRAAYEAHRERRDTADRRDRGAGGHAGAGRSGVHPAGRPGHAPTAATRRRWRWSRAARRRTPPSWAPRPGRAGSRPSGC